MYFCSITYNLIKIYLRISVSDCLSHLFQISLAVLTSARVSDD
jgi:hypothetical protein